MKMRFLAALFTMLAGFTLHQSLQGNSVRQPAATGDSAGDSKFINPRITDHGRVVQLPAAADQPREGAKICVDLTRGGAPQSINAAIEKLARYINIYAGAGREPAEVEITVVLHGDATLCALSADDYSRHFGTQGNPNLGLMRDLREAGVEFRVCGQSLAGKGFTPEHLCDDVDVSVSALTALVNRQADGYSYVPLLK